jgi:S-adenosylmethionine hydrolase
MLLGSGTGSSRSTVPFGSLITGVGDDLFQKLDYRLGDKVRIKAGSVELTVPYVSTFGDVPLGQPLLYIDSSGLVSFAINQGDFAKVHGIVPPAELVVSPK